MYFTKSTIAFSILCVGAHSAALPEPAERSTVRNSIAERSMPTIGHNAITKRATPTISDGINVNDPQRGGKLVPRSDFPTSGAFSNAFQLMSYAVTARDETVFAKYFNTEDGQLVTDIFNRLLGDDGVSGAAAIANIQVVAGDPGEEDPAPAELEAYANPDPKLLLSEDAWVYPDRDDNPDACAEWESEGMTQDMYLLGSVLVHEYTHWDWFIGSIHGGEVIDQPNGYGFANARALDKSLAKYNADSYGWFATENFWTIICTHAGGYDDSDAEVPQQTDKPDVRNLY